MRNRRIFCLTLSMMMAASGLAGCGADNNTNGEVVELVEPVGIKAEFAFVERHELIKYTTLAGKAVPKVTEVTFASSQAFDHYGVLPGNEVKKGKAILYASTENIDDQIERLSDQIENDAEAYAEYNKEINETLSELRNDLKTYEKIVGNFEAMNDEQKKAYGGRGYDAEYADYKFKYSQTLALVQRNEENLKERTELYDLDSNYNKKQLKRLQKKRSEAIATAPEDGIVCAINYFMDSVYVNRDTSVAGVCDMSQIEVKTERVYRSDISRADDVYALVNGKRYETSLKELTAEDIDMANNQDAEYSTFLLDDPNGEVKAGDYVVIVLINQRKEDALCVPNDAISSDADGDFVYLYDGDKTNRVSVTTGMKSGMFTEIVSGLNEGDKVVSAYKINAGKKTMELTKGSMSGTYSGTGELFYSFAEDVKNPIKYGTAYIDEITVKMYERVVKGQEIAKIHVSSDSVGIKRQERTLQRAQEDLQSLIDDNDEEDSLRKQIDAQQEYVDNLQETLNDMKKDASTVSVKSPINGIITGTIWFEAGDILQPNAFIATVADENNCFLEINDADCQLSIGDTANVKYTFDNKEYVCEGEVVTVANCAVTKGLASDLTLIKVSGDDMALMSMSNWQGDWWMRSVFPVEAKVRSMDNVVLVPKSAVTVDNGITYVRVLDENNQPYYKSFLVGGSDNTNYWVVEGLTEGTKICLE